MFDYWAKFQSGLSAGHNTNLGQYTDCIRFSHQSQNTQIGRIQGQYCLINHRATATKNETDWNENFDWREM